MTSEPLHGVLGEDKRAVAKFIRKDLRVSQPGMVVDGDVKIFPSLAVSSGAVVMDAVLSPSILASFLMSICINSPGFSRSYRHSVGGGNMSRLRLMPCRPRYRQTVL